MENVNYKMPEFNALIHQFEYNGSIYNVQIDRFGSFVVEIYSENKRVYAEMFDTYESARNLFYVLHTLVVPVEVKNEAGYEDGSWDHPMKSLDELFGL